MDERIVRIGVMVAFVAMAADGKALLANAKTERTVRNIRCLDCMGSMTKGP